MEKCCKICFEEEGTDDRLIVVCPCKGSVKWIHDSCLRTWFAQGHNECCVCKTVIRTEDGDGAEIVPYNWWTIIDKALLGSCAECIWLLYGYLLVMTLWFPEVRGDTYFYGHAAYQQVYYAGYVGFCWWRWLRHIKKKKLYMSMIWADVRTNLFIQLGSVLGLWFIHNPVYHLSAVLLSRYMHRALLYVHYTTLAEMNQLVPFIFVEWLQQESE